MLAVSVEDEGLWREGGGLQGGREHSATLSGPGLGDWLGSESLRSSWTDEPVPGSGPVTGHGDTRRADEGAAPRRAGSSCWVNVWCHSGPPHSAGAPGAAGHPLPHGARCGAGLERHGAHLAVRLLQGPAADLLRGGGAVAPPARGPGSPCGVLSLPAASQSGFLVSSGFVRACRLCVAWAWVHTVRGCRAEFSRERWIDHAFGLGKPCLKFTGRNEAEFAMWCLKTLKLAKCLSNASHLPWMGRAVPCPTVNPAEMKKVGPLHLSFVVSPKT